MSTKAKTWFDRLQFLLTVFLIPMVLGAWSWAGRIESRIGANETAIKMADREHARDDAADIEVARLLKEMASANADTRERMVRMETQIQAIIEELRKR